jgi:hypothetical protein
MITYSNIHISTHEDAYTHTSTYIRTFIHSHASNIYIYIYIYIYLYLSQDQIDFGYSDLRPITYNRESSYVLDPDAQVSRYIHRFLIQ